MRQGNFTQNGFDEAIRYYRNARELLGRCKVEDGIYADIKPVREAFGTAWLAVDATIKAALKTKDLTDRQIPRSWEPLLAAVVKHLTVRNGKLVRLIHTAYETIHKEGYYYGAYRTPALAKDAFDIARRVIETLSGRKIG